MLAVNSWKQCPESGHFFHELTASTPPSPDCPHKQVNCSFGCPLLTVKIKRKNAWSFWTVSTRTGCPSLGGVLLSRFDWSHLTDFLTYKPTTYQQIFLVRGESCPSLWPQILYSCTPQYYHMSSQSVDVQLGKYLETCSWVLQAPL